MYDMNFHCFFVSFAMHICMITFAIIPKGKIMYIFDDRLCKNGKKSYQNRAKSMEHRAAIASKNAHRKYYFHYFIFLFFRFIYRWFVSLYVGVLVPGWLPFFHQSVKYTQHRYRKVDEVEKRGK